MVIRVPTGSKMGRFMPGIFPKVPTPVNRYKSTTYAKSSHPLKWPDLTFWESGKKGGNSNPLKNNEIFKGFPNFPFIFPAFVPSFPIFPTLFREWGKWETGKGIEGSGKKKTRGREMQYQKPLSEEQEQQELVAWFKREYGPELAERLHHSPNGGHRHPATARRMKYLGVRRGFPDLVLYLPRGGFVGCVLELKQTDSGADCSDFQKGWLEVLSECGFDCWGPVNGLEQGRNILSAYMALDPYPEADTRRAA